MGKYLEGLNGCWANSTLSPDERARAEKLKTTNNDAERPFACAKLVGKLYPSMSLKHKGYLAHARCSSTFKMLDGEMGFVRDVPERLRVVLHELTCVRVKTAGDLTIMSRKNYDADLEASDLHEKNHQEDLIKTNMDLARLEVVILLFEMTY